MKRFMCTLLASILIAMLCACNSAQQIEVPVNYYYRTRQVQYNSDTGVISAEIREAKGSKENYHHLIEQYLNGPKSNHYISPFPAGTTLEELNVDNNRVQIVLSPHMALLSGSELMIACICLARTLLEMTGVKYVQISAENSLLNNEQSITLSSDSFVLIDLGADYVRR